MKISSRLPQWAWKLFIAFTLFTSEGVAQNPCPNIDFEMGNFTNWQGQLGTCCPILTTPSAITPGRHTITSGTATDPNACNAIPVKYPGGGNYSARLGNQSTGAQAERLSYSFTVPNNALFVYRYAVVLEDPGHDPIEQPRFQIRVLDVNGNLIDPVCGFYSVVADANIPGFQNCIDVRYKNWTTVGIDLSAYVGQVISIEFSTGDCDLTGHFGYAYLDAMCSSLQITSNFCANSTIPAVLTAPVGFAYQWSTGDTTQSISIPNPQPGSNYSVVLTSVTGCTATLSSLLTATSVRAGFQMQSNCSHAVEFVDTSTVVNGTLTGWLWDFGDGTTSTDQHPVHYYPSSGFYTVRLIAVTDAGCTDTVTRTVQVIPSPDVAMTLPDGCAGVTVNLTSVSSVSTGTIVAWHWDLGGTLQSASPNVSHAYPSGGSHPVTFTATASNGCQDSISGVVNILDFPVAQFSTPDTIGCAPLAVQLSNQSTQNGTSSLTWHWEFGDGDTSSASSPLHTYADSGRFDIQLTVENDFGCSDSYTLPVVVIRSPVAQFTSPDTLGCSPLEVHFTNQSSQAGGSALQMQWQFGDGNSSTAQDPVHVYTAPGIDTVTLTVTNLAGCTDTYAGTVRILETPVANFSVSDTAGCDPFSVQFTDLSTQSGSTLSWFWQFGDSTNSSVRHPSHLYSTPGSYVVTLTATSPNGCDSSVSQPLTVHASPVAAFFTADSAGCTPYDVSITDLSTQAGNVPISWSWRFGDGQNGIQQHPLHQYTLPGNFVLSLAVTNANGCVDSASRIIDVLESPVAQFSTPDTLGCTPFAVHFLNQTTQAGSSVMTSQWQFGDSLPSFTWHPVHIYPASGNYAIRLVVSNTHGCADSVEHPVTVVESPQVNFTTPDRIGCNPYEVHFTDMTLMQGNATLQYAWHFGDGLTSALQNPVHLYPDAGVYTISLAIVNENLCADTLTVVEMVEVLEQPVAAFTPDPAQVPMFYSMVNFWNQSLYATQWHWDFGDGEVFYGSPASHQYSEPGKYAVTLIIMNEIGCRDTAYGEVEVIPEMTVYAPNAFSPNGDGRNETFHLFGSYITSYSLAIFDRWGEKIFETRDFDEEWNGTDQNKGMPAPIGVYFWIATAADYQGHQQNFSGTVTLIR